MGSLSEVAIVGGAQDREPVRSAHSGKGTGWGVCRDWPE